MRLERLELANFRSYKKKTFQFGDTTVIVGPNGAGKTNILEAIYLLSTGTSPRASRTEEMLTWGTDIATVTGVVRSQKLDSGLQERSGDREESYTSLTVVLTPGVYMGKRTTKRRYLVDQLARTRARFAGRLISVLFRPEDLRLVEGSPSRRRQFLDDTLIQSSLEYAKALTAYEGALRRRNRILDEIREGRAGREQLAFWDATMIKNGNILTEHRRTYLEYLSTNEVSFGRYKVEYDSSTISPERLAKYAQEEVAAGYTLVGPHKDDFVVLSTNNQAPNSKGKNLHIYGSRGEQRLGVLFLKIGALQYLERELKVQPLLLLDDIFSELDQKHRTQVVTMTKGRQTILTTAEPASAEAMVGIEAHIIQL